MRVASTDKTPLEGLPELQQMGSAPSDGYSAGEWCKAANDLLLIVDVLLARERELTEALSEALEIVTSLDFEEQSELGRLMELLWRALHPAVLNSEERP